jgi:hypothetical protein
VNPFNRFGIPVGLIESFSHRFQVLHRKGLETDINRDTATSGESFQDLLIKGDGNRGVAIPEEIEIFEKGEKFKTKPLIPSDVGIDDIEKSSLEEIRKIFAQYGEDSSKNRVHHRSLLEEGFEFSFNFADGAIPVSKSKEL